MISDQFEACSFVADVREVYDEFGILQLQQKLLNDLLILRDMNVKDVDNGLFMIKNRLRYKKILLVLDDVNELDQLNKLGVKQDWLGPGSRVIITTRDVKLLNTHKVDGIYEVEILNNDEAFHLFNLKAFDKEHPTKDYLELSQGFVHYANGLPLAIEVLGSFLNGRSTSEWKSELDRLGEFPERKILNVLQISFDGLHETEKEIFLNIACFFNHINYETIIAILDCLRLYPEIGLRGTKAIQGIVLKLPKPKEVHWDPESFSKMHHLKFLIIKNSQLCHGPKHLPNDLGFLDWSGYPSKSLPTSFQPNELIELHMCCSNIERLWKGTKSCEMLKFIKLNRSLKFFETPDFTKIPILEKLILEDCINLRKIHPSIGVHKKLALLNLKGCKNLRSLPGKFEMESLEILILSKCSNLKRIPEFGETMKRVSKLYLDGTAITKLPTSIGNLIGLSSLDVRDCKNLMSLPSTFFNIKSLKDLNLFGCSKLLENLGNAESVKELDVNGQMPSSNAPFEIFRKIAFGGFQFVPFYSTSRSSDPMGLLSSSLFGLSSLTTLNLSNCNLKAIPNDIGCLFSLQDLDLSGNNFGGLPESIAHLSILKHLNVKNCTSLRSFPNLPLSIAYIWGNGCSSLETVPNLLKPNSSCEPELELSNCSKLADNQGFIDLFFAVIKKSPQGLSPKYQDNIYQIVFPGSEIPEWFSHQCMGDEVNIMEPFSHLRNEWIGIAVCVVFCSGPHFQIYHEEQTSRTFGYLTINGKQTFIGLVLNKIVDLSDHICLDYRLPESCLNEKDRKSLWECDANGFCEIVIKFENTRSILVKKCGLRVVCKKDIEDLNWAMAECSNNSIIPYKGLDIPHHYFDNSAVVVEGNQKD
uniref:ADP-ribosyl cyclase/cyclic ADP-ribose hydrolase n=1 Tax=Quercus lobata TaxID=97700 RepID=A0A7N2MH25_QUELO